MVQTAARAEAETPRSTAQKQRILEAAGRVFRRRGLHDAGMREIAAELGMHAGNLYYYFRNKAELLAFCQEQTLDRLLETAEGIRASSKPYDIQLAQLIEAHVDQLNRTTPASLAHLEVEALEKPWRCRIQRRRDDYEAVYRELIESGARCHLFRPVDPQVAAMAILGAVNWTVKWYRSGGAKDAATIGREFADLMVAGLRKAVARECDQGGTAT